MTTKMAVRAGGWGTVGRMAAVIAAAALTTAAAAMAGGAGADGAAAASPASRANGAAAAATAGANGAAAAATAGTTGAAEASAGANGAAAADAAPVMAVVDPAPQAVRQEVETILAHQTEAWNRGDLIGFTSIYSDDASFVSVNGITRGREEVLARYRRRYPDRGAMGRLSLTVQEARALGEGAVSVVAHWRISHAADGQHANTEGSTLLVMRHLAGGWKIVQDASM